jgi:hypothetical protein
MFIDRINQKTNGELQVTFAGPEVSRRLKP